LSDFRAATPQTTPLLFIVNPASGQTSLQEVRETITRVMSAAGRDYEILIPKKPRLLPSLAVEAVNRAMAMQGAAIAVGGDGTINAVAQPAVEAACPFGVLSQGTFNYFARAHGISQELEAALNALLISKVVPVNVGMVNERVFLVNASLGLYPKVLQDREDYKKQWGRHRWVATLGAALTILRHDHQLRLRIELHESVHDVRTTTLFVCNNTLQLERLGLPHAERLSEGEMAAVGLKPSSRIALFWLLLRGAFGRLGEADNISTFPFAKMVVNTRSGRPIRVATDGEVVMLHGPLRFAVSPRPLLLLCPPGEGEP
jgi:diacylglycerol kinase family enzyme